VLRRAERTGGDDCDEQSGDALHGCLREMDACGTVYAKWPGLRLEGEDFEAELLLWRGIDYRGIVRPSALSTSLSFHFLLEISD
jgi:hypothetical protein